MPFGIGSALKKGAKAGVFGVGPAMLGGGLFGSGPRYPRAPDPSRLAAEQFRYNQLSPVNQQGPFGSLTYTTGPDGRLTATSKLDAAGEAAIGGARSGAGQWLAQFLKNYGGDRPDFSADRGRVEDAIYNRYSSRLDPQYADREKALMSRLEAQGITQGSTAFQNEMDRFNRERRDAYGEARTDAVLGGGAEQSRLFDMLSQARGQDFGEVGGLFGLGQLGTPPQGVSTIASPDFMGAANNQYLGQIGAYNAAQQQQAAQTQGLFNLGGSLGAAAIMACSRTFKDESGDAPSVLDLIASLPIKEWNYKGEDVKHVGPYAEDWSARFGGPDKFIYIVDAIGVLLKGMQELRQEVRSLKHGN